MTSITIGLVLALAATPDSAGFHTPSAERITFLNEQLAQARWVDVATGAGTFMVNEPRADSEGIGYRRRAGGLPRRRAVFSSVREVATPVLNPIPWSQVESVTWRRSGTGPGAIGGGIVGAAVATGLVAIASIDSDPGWGGILMFGVGAIGAGAALGGLFGGLIESRQVLYHAAGSPVDGALDPGAEPASFAQSGPRAVLLPSESAPDTLRFSPR